ncbi:MAG: DEAD/DEAH box helicase family protein [Clostridia bacterium]|nr:DEAD/DEAH box helicase family protein [Clostridia bacterium]
MSSDPKSGFDGLGIEDIIKIINADGSVFSSGDLGRMISKLQKWESRAKLRERQAEEKRKREEAERKAREEKEKKEAHIREVTSMDLPLDWENVFNSDARTQGVHTDSIPDALVMSLTTLGKVDIEYISSVTGADYKTVIGTLKGSIYQNPLTWNECFYKGWETSDEYLSGNLIRKWNAAKEADKKYKGYFSDNVRAIEAVLPPTVAAKDIYITLGSPWVPADIIDDFIIHMLGDPGDDRYYYRSYETRIEDMKTVHDEITGTWEIPEKSRYNHSVGVRKTYGTDKLEALHILEKTLNMKAVAVTDEIQCLTNASGTKRVINKTETVAAIEKQQKMIAEFQKWVWQDEKRKERLETIFENKFSCVKRRIFDGSFLTFPGMSPSVGLYPYQKDAVARIIFTPNTLLAHDVGAGKTYVMIAAGQELLRMGLSKKNLYVVPNNIVGQWKNIFSIMYPNANVLCVDPKSFAPHKREDVLEKIRDNDYDGIIMAYSCFEQIPLSKEYYVDELKKKKEKLAEAVKDKTKATSRLKKKREAAEKALAELLSTFDDMYDTVYFDELGITRLFVDEAHNFKNVPIDTKAKNVLGINSTGSKKCQDMMDKVHMVQKQNCGKGVVFATGTPITNSITDAYIIQRYLQSGELALIDLQSFDGWIGMFAEKVTEFEIDVDTSTYRLATRFSKFHNLPELTALLSSIADFHQVDESAGIPAFDGYNDALISKTPDLAAYLDDISLRADQVRSGTVGRKEDNMLKITTDGRKAALDLRLVDPNAVFTYQSKVARCSETVADIYYKTSPGRCAQLIFCDTSTPKAGFNIYTELKDRLVLLGVPENVIAFIHDAGTEAKRSVLFAKVRSGEIRILIGSTFKLGLGVNVQERLIAMHHIDVPWRPADMTQREGRILRQGNTNRKIYIFRYITEGSFDAYSWQLLETKQRFISGLLSGSLTERSGGEIENTVLDYAEVKALAVGDPMIKQRVETANELSRYMTLQRKAVDSKLRLEKELLELPGRIKNQLDLIENCKRDIASYADWQKDNPPAADNRSKKEEAEKRKQLREFIGSALKDNILKMKEITLVSYRGFDLILPANMIAEKPFVWLKKSGRYYVELGDTDTGNLIRIDNCLDSLSEYLDKLSAGLEKLRAQEKDIKAELAKDENYLDEIEKYSKALEKIDKKLGVDKK